MEAKRGYFWLRQYGMKEYLIIDPDGKLVDLIRDEKLGQGICDELNSIKKPTNEQLTALADLIEKNTHNSFGIKNWGGLI